MIFSSVEAGHLSLTVSAILFCLNDNCSEHQISVEIFSIQNDPCS